MTKVVLDTNIFISALFWKGAPYNIFQKVINNKIENFISPEILKEIKEKLLNKFSLPEEKLQEFLEIIVFSSKVVYPKNRLDVVKQDSKDNKIIECAVEARASFIISGDKHLLNIKEYNKIKIISPSNFK